MTDDRLFHYAHTMGSMSYSLRTVTDELSFLRCQLQDNQQRASRRCDHAVVAIEAILRRLETDSRIRELDNIAWLSGHYIVRCTAKDGTEYEVRHQHFLSLKLQVKKDWAEKRLAGAEVRFSDTNEPVMTYIPCRHFLNDCVIERWPDHEKFAKFTPAVRDSALPF